MAVPAHVLRHFVVNSEDAPAAEASRLPLGIPELDAMLPDGGLPLGAVVEFSVQGTASLATSLALAACRAAQQQSLQYGAEAAWCAFVDPSRTLYGPGVYQAGVALDRLLVIQPKADALSRVTLRLAESRVFSVIVIDSMGILGTAPHVALGSWSRIVRRLSVAAAESNASLVLITDGEAPRPLPLPVSLRLELTRPSLHKLSLRVAKDKRGRISTPRSIAWARPDSKHQPSGRAIAQKRPELLGVGELQKRPELLGELQKRPELLGELQKRPELEEWGPSGAIEPARAG